MREIVATCVPGSISPEGRKELITAGCQLEIDGERMRVVWPEGTSYDTFSGNYTLRSGAVVSLKALMRASYRPCKPSSGEGVG